MPVGTSVGQIMSDLELPAMSSLIRVLATVLRSSARAASAVNCQPFIPSNLYSMNEYQFISALLIIQNHGSVLVCYIFYQKHVILCVFMVEFEKNVRIN